MLQREQQSANVKLCVVTYQQGLGSHYASRCFCLLWQYAAGVGCWWLDLENVTGQNMLARGHCLYPPPYEDVFWLQIIECMCKQWKPGSTSSLSRAWERGWTYSFQLINGYITFHVGHLNPLTTNDAYMRHDPCELSISLWEFIWSIKY